MVHRDWHIANGIPASRVLDKVNPPNQSRFGVTSAFLRADSPALGLHPSSAAQKESRTQATDHWAQKRRRSLHQTNTHACQSPRLYLVMPAYTKSRFAFAKALVPQHVQFTVCIGCRQRPNYCAVLTLEIILRIFPPFACA